jgi:hypothetical protein
MLKQCICCQIEFNGRRTSSYCSRSCKALGDSQRLSRSRNQEILSFWSQVEKTDSCWLWKGTIGKSSGHNYGLCNLDNTRQLTHRISWQLHFGNIPIGLFVCHKCDNPICINPEHLFLGTNYDNVRDMIAKKRNSRGEKHALAVLRSLLQKYGDQL